MSYHVGVSNLFEVLQDENDDAPKAPVKQETPKNKPAKETPAPQQAAAKAKQPTAAKGEKPTDAKGKQENRSPKADKGEKRPTKGGESGGVSAAEGEEEEKKRRQARQGSSERVTDRRRSDRPPREQGHQDASSGSSATSGGSPSSGGGSGGGGGGGGGGGKVKRIYERKSGTGRGKEGKKGGSGKGNWGAPGTDDQTEPSEVPDQPEEEGQAKEDAPKKEGEQTTPAPETEEERKLREEREKEEKAIDFEEYKKRMEEKAPKIPLPEPRQADSSTKWGDYVVLQRDEEDVPADKQKAKKAKEGSKEGAKKQVPVDKIFKVQEEKRRGDRPGGFRKGPNNGNNKPFGRGKRGGKTSAPSFDPSSFPALSTKA